MPGIETTPDKIGETLLVISGVGVAAHAVSMATRKQINKVKAQEPEPPAGEEGRKE